MIQDYNQEHIQDSGCASGQEERSGNSQNENTPTKGRSPRDSIRALQAGRKSASAKSYHGSELMRTPPQRSSPGLSGIKSCYGSEIMRTRTLRTPVVMMCGTGSKKCTKIRPFKRIMLVMSAMLTPAAARNRALVVSCCYRDTNPAKIINSGSLCPSGGNEGPPDKELKSSFKDGERMEEFLEEKDFEVTRLWDTNYYSCTTNQDYTENNKSDDSYPSKKNVENIIKNWSKTAVDGDTFFFYFTGHGLLGEGLPPGKGYKKGDETFNFAVRSTDKKFRKPEDGFDFVTSKFVNKHFKKIAKKNTKVFIMVDACHSGGAAQLQYQYDNDDDTWDEVEESRSI